MNWARAFSRGLPPTLHSGPPSLRRVTCSVVHRGTDACRIGAALARACEDGRRLRDFASIRRGSKKPHRDKLSYFIPEWDDLVDRDFDFETDSSLRRLRRLVERGLRPPDVSRTELRRDPHLEGRRREEQEEEGAHQPPWRASLPPRPTRVPHHGGLRSVRVHQREGARRTRRTRSSTTTRGSTSTSASRSTISSSPRPSPTKKARYDLTIENAAEFLKKHRKAKLPWTPIGAVQGWDPKSYAAAAKKYVAMGYEYIGLGGLVRTSTPEIVEVLRAVHEVVPASREGAPLWPGAPRSMPFGLREAWRALCRQRVVPAPRVDGHRPELPLDAGESSTPPSESLRRARASAPSG